MQTFDAGSLGALSPQECLRLLAVPGEAQVNLTRHPLPEPLPLGFELEDDTLLLRPEAAGPLVVALVEADLTVEVGTTDRYARSGWRVVVTGRAEATGDGALRLLPTSVSGYRITLRQTA